MISNSIFPVPIKNGIYCGSWRGCYVCVSIGHEVTRFKVDKSLRDDFYPCIVVINDKKAYVDSGNPIGGLIEEWKEKSVKWDEM